MKTIWAITHGAVIDCHWGYKITYIKEETVEKALKFFNEKLANIRWIQKAKIEDIEQIKIHEGV